MIQNRHVCLHSANPEIEIVHSEDQQLKYGCVVVHHFDNCSLDFLDPCSFVFDRFSLNFHDLSKTFPGHFLDMSRKFPATILEISTKLPGHTVGGRNIARKKENKKININRFYLFLYVFLLSLW